MITVQGQNVKGQGHKITKRNSSKNAIPQQRFDQSPQNWAW